MYKRVRKIGKKNVQANSFIEIDNDDVDNILGKF